MAPYTSSKFALTALGDSLLRRQGIGVTVIEPGAIATDIWAKGDGSAQEFTPEIEVAQNPVFHSLSDGDTAFWEDFRYKEPQCDSWAI